MTFADAEQSGKWTELKATVLNIANSKTQSVLLKDESGRNEWVKNTRDSIGWIENDDLIKTIPFRVRWNKFAGFTGYSLKPKVLGDPK